MTTQIRTIGALFAGVLLMSAVLPGTAFAVDGQIAITQARAMGGGVTPGDAPGFPVTITLPGSYVLAGNLTVPDANTSAIVINASHVTIDLNGFAILGSTDCSAFPCSGSGSGSGIAVPPGQVHITIRNGTIQGMGAFGIALDGDSHLVEYMHVRSNGNSGISIGQSTDPAGSIVQHNTVVRNGFIGIHIQRGIVSHNTVDINDFQGIRIETTGNASYNVITRNGNFRTGPPSRPLAAGVGSYFGNVISGNVLDSAVGGTNLGQNLCGNAVCPGAQF
jgi:hypothetical protein